MRVALLIASGSTNLYSAISSAGRIYEEFPVEEFVLVHTSSSKGNAEKVKELLDGLKVKVTLKEIPSDKEGLSARVKSLKSIESIDLAVISPAGASLSAASSRVFERIAHVTFPFSFWSGFTYPHVPREMQRVYAIEGEEEFYPSKGGRSAHLMKGVVRGGPIRREMASLVSKYNSKLKRCLNSECKSTEIKVEVTLKCVQKGGYRDEVRPEKIEIRASVPEGAERKDVHNAFKKLKEWERRGFQGLTSILWLSGLLPIVVLHGEERVPSDKVLIADTSAIYLGLLNHYYAGFRVRVPRCALYEMLHKYEEAIKPEKKKFDLIGLLSKALYDEVKAAGVEFPSPPDFCDKAFLQLDPMLLADNYIVTEDYGIRTLWEGSPLNRLAKLASLRRLREPEDSPSSIYGLFQFHALMKTVSKELRDVYGERGTLLSPKYGDEDCWLEGRFYRERTVIDSFSSR